MALTPIQKEILNKIYYGRRYMTIREIADITEYSWQTIEYHLNILYHKHFVKKIGYTTNSPTKQERTKWIFNYEYYKKLKSKQN